MELNKTSCSGLFGPASCIGLLVLLTVALMCPVSSSQPVNAVDVATTSDSVGDTPPQGEGEFVNPENGENSNDINNEPPVESKEPAVDGADQLMAANAYNASNPDAGIMTTATSPVTTFSIGGAGVNETVETSVDTVAYRSHTVSIGISNADDYYLMISGDPNLNLAGGSASLTGITGSNVTGANIPAGQWGYSWDYTNSKTNETMVYSAVPSGAYKLSQPSLTNNAVNFTGKLNFAAKFPNNSVLGSYSSNVTLTLVVTPKANTGSATWKDATGAVTAYEAGTGNMQGISSVSHGSDGGFCKNNSKIGTGWTVDLQDNRGTNPVTYTIVKLKDGNCWMQQNLRLTAPSGGLILTSADSNVSSSWTMPATLIGSGSSVSGWTNDNNKPYSAYFNNATYGVYYNWTAAIAMNDSSGKTSGSATTSICPKGWHLPTGNTNGELYNLTNGLNMSTITAAPYKFPAAGYVNNGSLYNAGSYGFYWSSTASNSAVAYILNFRSSNFSPGTGYSDRYLGYSVRCVASY